MLTQDLRYALRGLWLDKGFSTVAILCLGLGIGVNATIFSTLDGVLLKPYPYVEPDRLLVVGEQNAKAGEETGLSYQNMRDWKAATTAVTTIAASSGRSLTIADGAGDPERYVGSAISWDLFPMLGVLPILGRGFTAEDDRPGAGGAVLLGHDLWTRRYQADPNILGRTIIVNAKPHVVVGVMPLGFAFPEIQRLWIPLAPLVTNDPRDARNLFAFARLAPGVTIDQARQEIDARATELARQDPAIGEGWTSRLRTLREEFLPPEVPLVIYLMMAGSTLVLFIACSNVANLLLARASSRRREISVRAALGAGRWQIVRQLLTESVMLGLLSVPLGLALAQAGTRAIESAIPRDQVPYYVTWAVDWRSVAYTVTIAVSTAVFFGLFPAWQVSRGNLHEALKDGTRGNSGGRSLVRSALVVAQVALAVVSLVGALLFVRTFANLQVADLGFDTSPLMTMRFYLPGERYEVEGAKLRRVEDIVRRVEALPGVHAAFASNYVPLGGGGGGGRVVVDGRPVEPGRQPSISLISVTPHFHRTLGLAVTRGRDFDDLEGWSRTPVAVINETMATRLWDARDPIGSRFRLASSAEPVEWFTVIGIVSDINLYGIDPGDDQPPSAAFVPYAYQQSLNTGVTIRVAGDPASITAAVRGELRTSDPTLPVFQTQTMTDLRRLSFWMYSLYGWVFGTIGVMGLVLASVGVYGVLSYSVAQRTQEIGVRVALGAGRGDVFRLIVRYGLVLAGTGVGLGVVLAPLLTWFGRVLFYRVSPFDPVSFFSVALFLIAVSLVASLMPARRAMQVDPAVALRGE